MPLREWDETYDGEFRAVEVDLSSLAGSSVEFVLAVQANGAFNEDWAFWLAPRIVGIQVTEADRLYLIDGHALAYRAYYALTRGGDPARWMTNSGEPTAGTYGFTSVILRLLEQDSPEYLAVSFDVGKTFRDEIFADYKGTREKMPDDLRLQIKRIREVVAAFGIPILEAEGYEADDVLGTVAKRAGADGVQVIILTGDRDLLQLVDKQVAIRLAGTEAIRGDRLWPQAGEGKVQA